MQIRALVGRPRPFREIVVRPRPTATSPSGFAVAALGTATVLTATIIGMSQLGVNLGPSSHSGRILAGPPTPTSTSLFSGFGAPAPLPVTIPPESIPPVAVPPVAVPPVAVPPANPPMEVPVGGAAHQPSIGSAVEAAGVHPQTPAGVRNQGVTAVSAVLNVPLARPVAKPLVATTLVAKPLVATTLVAKPLVTMVSVASAYPLAIMAIPYAPTPLVVPVSKSERADGTSEGSAKHDSAKAQKHKRDHTKAAKAHSRT